jgi:hypothetical protein
MENKKQKSTPSPQKPTKEKPVQQTCTSPRFASKKQPPHHEPMDLDCGKFKSIERNEDEEEDQVAEKDKDEAQEEERNEDEEDDQVAEKDKEKAQEEE